MLEDAEVVIRQGREAEHPGHPCLETVYQGQGWVWGTSRVVRVALNWPAWGMMGDVRVVVQQASAAEYPGYSRLEKACGK